MTASNKPDAAILVMDSGAGGLSILNALIECLPNEHYIYLADYEFLPYGEKSAEQIRGRCEYLIEEVSKKHEIKAVVLACNSATAASIAFLREKYSLLFFGTEPGIKPASQRSKTGIAVLATELTLGSESFKRLIKSYANDKPVINMPAPQLVYLVEDYWGDRHKPHREHVLRDIFDDNSYNFDTMLLGCTHFHFLKDELASVMKQPVTIIDTSTAISSWVKQKLEKENLLSQKSLETPSPLIFITGNDLTKHKDKLLHFLTSRVSKNLVIFSLSLE